MGLLHHHMFQFERDLRPLQNILISFKIEGGKSPTFFLEEGMFQIFSHTRKKNV